MKNLKKGQKLKYTKEELGGTKECESEIKEITSDKIILEDGMVLHKVFKVN